MVTCHVFEIHAYKGCIFTGKHSCYFEIHGLNIQAVDSYYQYSTLKTYEFTEMAEAFLFFFDCLTACVSPWKQPTVGSRYCVLYPIPGSKEMTYHTARSICASQPGGDSWLPRMYNVRDNMDIGEYLINITNNLPFMVYQYIWVGADDEDVSTEVLV